MRRMIFTLLCLAASQMALASVAQASDGEADNGISDSASATGWT